MRTWMRRNRPLLVYHSHFGVVCLLSNVEATNANRHSTLYYDRTILD